MKSSISLHNKIFLVFIFVVLIAISIVGWYGFKSTSDAYIESAYDLGTQSINSLNIEIEEKLEHIPKDVKYFADFYALKRYMIWKSMNVDKKAEKWKQIFSDTLMDFLETQQDYFKARILDLDGNELIVATYEDQTGKIFLTPENELQNKKGRDYVEVTKNLKKGEFFVSDLNLNIEHAKIAKPYVPVLRYATPVVNVYGDVIAIFVVNIYADKILKIVKNKEDAQKEKKASYFLIDKDGNYLYHENKAKRWNKQLKNGENFNKDEFELNRFTTTDVFTVNNKIYSYHKVYPLKGNNEIYWYVVASIDKDIALAKLEDFKKVFLLILLFVIVGSFISIRYYLLRITRPLTKVTSQLKALSLGEIKKENIKYDANDEVGEIVRSTSTLVDAIERTINQANAVADGDFTKDIELLSYNDKLGLAIKDMTSRLKEITHLAENLAVGNYDVNVTVKSSEDKLGIALVDMVKYLEDITNIAESVAVGELDVRYKARGSKDRLGRAVLRMIKYLKNILKQANAITKDDFSHTIEAKSQNDELGLALVSMTNILRQNNIKNKNEVWFSDGVGEFSDKLTGLNDVASLSKEAISLISRYVKASAGIVYIYHKDELLLKQTASFASENFNHYKLGTGVVGQVALEKTSLLLSDVEDEYYDIKTGTTSTRAKEVYLFALVYEDELYGVVELMSLHSFSTLEKDYLAKVANIFATSLHATIQNVRIKELLNDSQKAYEELQVQSEELQESNVQMEEQQQQLTLQTKDMKMKNNELTEAKEELNKKADDLEKASKYKNEFLANMSHELRTPLNSIILLSKLLAQNKHEGLVQSDIDKASVINKAGNDLLLLINDILDLSKVESGNMELDESSVYTGDILEELKGLFSEIAIDNKVAFELHDEFNDVFIVDKIKLLQIIKNLLSNAFKFTKEGTVSVNISQDQDRLKIDVSDTGLGIPEDKLLLIFEAFKQVDGSISREYGGTGLGLSISKTFVALMGGEIKVSSKYGEGSTFSILLPLKESKDVAKEEPKKETILEHTSYIEHVIEDNTEEDIFDSGLLEGKNILIVDDDSRNIFTLSSVLQELGAETFSALHGSEALELLKSETEKMDVILMDIMMPVMDGFETIKNIKNDERFKDIPIIAVTAKTMKEDKEACLQAGADDYLMKPIDQNALITMLKAWSK